MQYILGVDNGGTVSKAALYTVTGEAVKVASRSVPAIVPKPGWSERDMDELWNANVSSIREVVKESGVDATEILGVVLTGHGNGLYLVDENGSPVRNGIISNDSRAQGIVDRWNADGSYKEKCQPHTMQSLFAGGPLPILAWLNENEPETVEKTSLIFMVKDYVRYMMTGNASFEITDASCTDLLDMTTLELHETVFEKMNAGAWEGKLPPLINSTDIGGKLLPAVAAATGLRAGTPIIAGVSDISGAPVGIGGVSDYELSIIAGTWSINSYFSPEPVLDDRLFMTSLAPLPDRFLITEGSPTSAANLEWFIQKVLRQLPSLSEMSSSELYEICNELAFSEEAKSSQISYLPFLYGSNLHPHIPGSFTGIANNDGLPQMLRAIYEGVTFSHREHIERLKTYTDLKPRARLTGGVTRSSNWTQMFADVIGQEIDSVAVEESGILGAVIVGAVALNLYESVAEAAAEMVPQPTTVALSKSNYDESFSRWKGIVDMADADQKERSK